MVGTSNFITTTTGHFIHYIETVFLVHHYYKNKNVEKNEKNIESLSFVWFLNFDYLWRKYLWRFGVKK